MSLEDLLTFRGGPESLTAQGFPHFIEEKYNETLRKAAWFAYDGMWRAAASGIVKGALVAGAATMAVSAAIGGLSTGATLAAGVGEGLTTGLSIMTSAPIALPILAIGALMGGAYDVAVRQSKIQKELAEVRLKIGEAKGVVKEYEAHLENGHSHEEGIEAPISYGQENSVSAASDHWQQHVAKRRAEHTDARGVS